MASTDALATTTKTNDDPPLDDDAVEAAHIAPSTLVTKKPPPQPQKARGATGCLVMAPPPPRPPPQKKIVLEEEEYVDELRRIIQRDYFPDGASRDDVAALDMSLDAFAAKHTSEDNASFEEALERARNAHVRKYWWCYDAERLKAAGLEVPDTSSLNTHLLSDGTRISDERRLQADAAAADEPMAADNAQRLLDFAPHEPRNALLFPPAYEGAQQRPVVKAIQRANTRFKEEPRARANTTGSYPDLSSVSSETTSAAADEGLVPMTPRILPGGDQSPLMTWGAVAATPRILESDDRRQELGRALDARAKRRRTAQPAPSPLRAALDARRASQRRPSSSRPSRSSSARTPGRSPAPPRPR